MILNRMPTISAVQGSAQGGASPQPRNVFDFDPEQHVGALPSPCVNICKMSPDTGYCEGCLRSIDEIVGWGNASEARKLAVWRELKLRIHEVVFK